MKNKKLNRRYNTEKTFEYNKKYGPFEKVQDQNVKIRKLLKTNYIKTDFFGYKTSLPLGVAAGPLYNKDYMKASAQDGFTVMTWKTFRSVDRIAHRNTDDFVGHNIVFVPPEQLSNKDFDEKIIGHKKYSGGLEDISITNSFGMPSDSPQIWMPEITEIENYMKKNGKVSIASVVGTPQEGGNILDLARDYAFTARCAESAGARIIEINLSCPNVAGKEGSMYKDTKNTALISKMVRENFRNTDTKLLIKVGYADKNHYRKLLKACGTYIDGVVAINTIPMQVVDRNGKQALPGGLKSGICGRAILDMAVESVKNLVTAKKELGLSIKIIGCGGVTSPESFMRHIDAGAEFVMCATAALFNPELPLSVAQYLKENISPVT